MLFHMVIGVYGLGRFGSFWAECLAKTGNRVIAYSRSKHVAINGVENSDESAVLNADLLFFCVAISSFEEVLKKVGDRIGRNTIVMDTCSVKSYPQRWMKDYLDPSIYRIATHPMFGPDSAKNGLKDLPIVLCPIYQRDSRFDVVCSLFKKMGLKILIMSADEHDREAAFSQGVTHFIGRILKDMNLEPTELATKGYKALMEIVEQTCNDPLQLFYDLQRYNPYTSDMRHSLRLAIEDVGYILEKGNEKK